jgi:myo-inositol-1(or 4)-monophosphatase
MIGSAAASLAAVARGAADVYTERNIMLWDVAAGLAIVEGAGGDFRCTPGTIPHALDVVAGNASLVEGFA